MNLNVRSQNSCFPLSYLPDDVIYHVAQYLSSRELGNMAQLNRHFRRIFNSPLLWKDITVQLPDRVIGSSALEVLKVRGIRDLDASKLIFNPANMAILQLPQLERLTLCRTTTSTLKALCNAASRGKLNLKKLAFGRVDFTIRTGIKRTFEELFKSLSTLEEVSLGKVANDADPPVLLDLHELGHYPLAMDLQRALCSTCKLTSISLVCFDSVWKSWLKTVITNNPHLERLCLSLICVTDFFGEGELYDVPEQAILSSLRTFELHITDTRSSSKKELNNILDWAFPSNKVPNRDLTSLAVTGPRIPIMFPQLLKFPALKKLNLSYSFVPKKYSLQDFPNFQNLEWLDLSSCLTIRGDQLPILSDKVGKSLRYLGLAKMPHFTDNDLRDLAVLFPILRTLDLSGCAQITDAVLVEWYMKHDKNEWPKLRKLILKGCEGITKEVVHSVRLKTKNQLLVDL